MPSTPTLRKNITETLEEASATENIKEEQIVNEVARRDSVEPGSYEPARRDSYEPTRRNSYGKKDGKDGKWAIMQSMIKQISNGTPIYRVSLPIFLQEPRSLLERYADFCSHMDIFTRYKTCSFLTLHNYHHQWTSIHLIIQCGRHT